MYIFSVSDSMSTFLAAEKISRGPTSDSEIYTMMDKQKYLTQESSGKDVGPTILQKWKLIFRLNTYSVMHSDLLTQSAQAKH